MLIEKVVFFITLLSIALCAELQGIWAVLSFVCGTETNREGHSKAYLLLLSNNAPVTQDISQAPL